jgi:hypothetical protein
MLSWILMILIGIWMAVNGFTRSNAAPFKYLVFRAAVLWKSNAHRFLGVAGVIIALVGFLLLAIDY